MSMRPFKRSETPPILAECGGEWSKKWVIRQKDKKDFDWPTVDGNRINHILLQSLMPQTQEHCSFCDVFPVSPPSKDTIEHFRPKSKFSSEAFAWDNLYFCCDFCQGQKREKYDEKTLRPDESGYCFDDYFRWHYPSGKLEPNPDASCENQERAQITIDIYGLNNGHPRRRLKESEKLAHLASSADINRDELPYRNFLFQDEVIRQA